MLPKAFLKAQKDLTGAMYQDVTEVFVSRNLVNSGTKLQLHAWACFYITLVSFREVNFFLGLFLLIVESFPRR